MLTFISFLDAFLIPSLPLSCYVVPHFFPHSRLSFLLAPGRLMLRYPTSFVYDPKLIKLPRTSFVHLCDPFF